MNLPRLRVNADVVGNVSSHTIPEAFNFGQFCNARLITLFTLLCMFRVRITKWRLVLHTRSSPIAILIANQ